MLGGYDFGDSWDDIKADHNEVFDVRDDDFKQLRRKIWDNAGSNGYYLDFVLDAEGKVAAFQASINGTKQNAVTVRKLLDDILARYEAAIGSGSCARIGSEGHSTSCRWPTVPGKPIVKVIYVETDDPILGSINIFVEAGADP